MTGGSVMDWWGEGRGARPLVVRDMSSGARDRTCVEGALLSALQATSTVGPIDASRAKTTSVSARITRSHVHAQGPRDSHDTRDYRPGR
jgi:hypothetical protein